MEVNKNSCSTRFINIKEPFNNNKNNINKIININNKNNSLLRKKRNHLNENENNKHIFKTKIKNNNNNSKNKTKTKLNHVAKEIKINNEINNNIFNREFLEEKWNSIEKFNLIKGLISHEVNIEEVNK
jgi:hypothetical protein